MVLAALAATAMLAAPFALLHGGHATAAAHRGRVAATLGPTQLVFADTVTGPTAAQLARHRSAVRHNEMVRAARIRWHHARVVAATIAAHEAYVAAVMARHDAAVAANEAEAAAARHRAAVRAAEARDARVGIATWYGWNPGQCASPFLPHGTLLTVTDLSTGKSIQCLVTDTEAHNPGRVVDLSNWCFEELAPLSQGVIEVRITW